MNTSQLLLEDVLATIANILMFTKYLDDNTISMNEAGLY